jgi:hypothetical protein
VKARTLDTGLQHFTPACNRRERETERQKKEKKKGSKEGRKKERRKEEFT